MEITRNTILDLLPLYAADEVSADTRALVEKFLETDPDLAKVAKQMASTEKPAEIPRPRDENGSLQAYRQARQRIIWTTLLIAAGISIVLIVILMFFLAPS